MRFNSTAAVDSEQSVATESVADTTDAVTETQHQRPRRLNFGQALDKIIQDEGIKDVDTLINRFQNFLEKEQKYKRISTSMATGLLIYKSNALMDKLEKLNTGAEGLSTATLNYKVLSILINYQLANVSQFNRVMFDYLKDGKPNDSLSLWIEFIEYSKSLPDDLKNAFIAVRNPIYEKAELSIVYLSYLYSCFLNKQQPSLEFYHSLIQDSNYTPSYRALNLYMSRLRSSSIDNIKEFEKFFQNFIRTCELEAMDPNSETFAIENLKAAQQYKISIIDNNYRNILKISKLKEIPVTEESFQKLMHAYSLVSNPAKAQVVWNEMIQRNITPSISSWNELLYSFSKVKKNFTKEQKDENLLKIEKTFNYILENVGINQDTIKYLICGYIANDEFEKSFKLIQELSSPKGSFNGLKINNDIKIAYILELLFKDKLAESEKIFQSFVGEKDSDFKPDIKVFNSFLTKYCGLKKFDKCEELINIMQDKYDLKPDIATYTILINLMFKYSVERNEKFDIKTTLSNIIQDMKQNNIEFNTTYNLTTIIDGLYKFQEFEIARLLTHYMVENKVPMSLKTYTTIINAESKSGDITIAEEFFKKSIKSGFKISTSFFNNIIDGCVKSDYINKAIKYYELLKNDKNSKGRTIRNKPLLMAILEDLSSCLTTDKDFKLGDGIPKILKQLKEKDVELPDKLNEVIL
ncbi:hypothetical protein PACTADRAFT_31182 [Pachysolen tannophilus NRRL Y-2460]|uniref:Mitochondrial 15S rRNA processing factor CCM1 n=1 Tax=Pachysolen tannophilus NRRL Y-2460 TaxID=669874 RepID=A0A1E4U197_PACTA|nr:hypothetical protein PACTADRAFT_31182 [Pachysolen tannophilus NRRL Y-2460]